MSLIFVDSQIKEATGQILAAPDKILGLQNARVMAVKNKQDFKDLDDASNVYTNNYYNIIQQYHIEYKYLTSTIKTDTSIAGIDAGARLATGNIYFPIAPTPWMHFQPMLNPENNGNPTTILTPYEVSEKTDLQAIITLMKSGFTSGAASLPNSATTSTLISMASTTGFSVGNNFVCYSNAGIAYGTIDDITVDTDMTCTTLYGDLATVGAGTVANHDAGFTVSQRETEAGISPAGRVTLLHKWEGLIDSYAATWKTMLNTELTALNANDALSPEAAQITNAKNNVTSAIGTITSWQAAPATGSGVGRYGVLITTSIEALISARTSVISARIAEITTALGSVTQAGDGTYSGTGQYFKLFDNINARINKVGGTLSSYYGQDLAISALDQQIALAQSTAARDRQTFDVKEFSADATGSNTIKVKEAGGLTVSQAVKIMSNTKPVIATTITGINDLEIQLGASITADYTLSDRARLVRQLA